MLRGIRNNIRELGGRGERDVDRFGSRLDAFLMPSDCNLMEELAVVEGDISHNIGTSSLAFTLTLGRELVDVSAMSEQPAQYNLQIYIP